MTKSMIMEMRTLLSLLLLAVVGLLPLNAQTFVLQPDATDGKDTEIWSSASQNAVLGNRESMNVYTWTYSGELSVKRMLVEFDFSSLPTDFELLDARLSIFFNPSDPYESRETHEGNNAIFIERIITDWDELAVNWNNQPATTAENRIEIPASSSPEQNYVDIDVKPLVQDMLADPDDSHGFLFKMQDEANPYRMLLFASSDHPNAAYRPKLVLTFKRPTSNKSVDKAELDFSLSPNPINSNTDYLTVAFPSFEPYRYSYTVVDLSGKSLLQAELTSETQAIDVSTLASAVYFLVIRDNNGNSSSQKFIVTRKD